MKKLGCALAVVLAVLSAALSSEAAVTLYVKPDASGSGASWADAAGLEAAIAAAKSAGGAYDIYLAKGVYYPSATIQLSNGISLYGGFKGDGSDTLETRDLENNVTILCGDVDKNDYWEHHDAGTGVVTALPETKIIVEGEIAVPAYTSDYDTYVPASASLSGNLMRLLAVQADATVTLDGLVLTGGGQGNKNNAGQKDDGYNKNFGSGLLIGDRAHATVRSCRVIACSAQYDVVHFGTGVAALEGCSVEHCYGVQYAAVCAATAATAGFTNCTFRGNARVNNEKGNMSRGDSAAVVQGFQYLAMNNCLFERNTLIKTFGGRHRAAAVLALPTSGAILDRLVGLRFVGNVTWSGSDAENAGQPSPLVSFGSATYKPSGWLFERNVAFSSGVADPSRIGLAFDTDFDLAVSGSTFVSNTLFVTGLSAEAQVAAAPVISSKRAEFLNCTFLGNDVQVTQSEGATVRASRALLSYRMADDTASCWVSAFNGTFAGETALPDMVVAGFQDNDIIPNCSFAGNSILWASGAAVSVPRAVAYGSGAADFIEMSRCIVRAPELLAQRVKTDEFVVEEDPLLEPLAFLSASDFVPVLRCGAKTPQIRNSFDVRKSFVGINPWPVLTYLPGGATSGGQTRCGNPAKPAADLVGDALGEARPSGSFTLGAVQSLAPVAESGVTVCCRVRPAGSGTVDGKRYATVVSAVGGTLEPLVAAAGENRQFDSWRNESMELLSEEASYVPSTAVAGSSYADAWFVDEQGEIVVTPVDDLQTAIDLASVKETGTVRLGAGVYRPSSALVANGTLVTVRSEAEAVIGTDTPGAKLFDNYGIRMDKGWGSKVVFDGVTFSQGRVDVGYAEAEFRNCQLLDCPAAGGNGGIVLSSNTNLLLSGSSFIGNGGVSVGRSQAGQAAHTCLWTVTNCCFTGNVGCGSLGIGISAGTIDLDIVDSKFEKNESTDTASPGLFQVDSDTICSIRKCVFAENLVSNAPAVLSFSADTQVTTISKTISNCLFVANRLMGLQAGSDYGVAIIRGASGYMVYNTTFLSNVVDVTRAISSEDAYHASITGGRNAYGLVNCHFEGNRTKITALVDGLHLYSSTSAFLRQARYPFVGCSYYGNAFDDGEIYMDRYASTVGNSWKAVNCIFWGDAADYNPIAWYDASKNRLDVYYCVMKNAPSEGRSETSIVNVYEGLQTSDPLFGTFVWRDGRAYRSIGRGSARRHGAALAISDAGKLVFRKSDGKYYLCEPETTESPKAQTVVAVAGDMFGDLPNVVGKFDIGPVQNTCPASGLMLIFR